MCATVSTAKSDRTRVLELTDRPLGNAVTVEERAEGRGALPGQHGKGSGIQKSVEKSFTF